MERYLQHNAFRINYCLGVSICMFAAGASMCRRRNWLFGEPIVNQTLPIDHTHVIDSLKNSMFAIGLRAF